MNKYIKSILYLVYILLCGQLVWTYKQLDVFWMSLFVGLTIGLVLFTSFIDRFKLKPVNYGLSLFIDNKYLDSVVKSQIIRYLRDLNIVVLINIVISLVIARALSLEVLLAILLVNVLTICFLYYFIHVDGSYIEAMISFICICLALLFLIDSGYEMVDVKIIIGCTFIATLYALYSLIKTKVEVKYYDPNQ